jgi:hypothetical protein
MSFEDHMARLEDRDRRQYLQGEGWPSSRKFRAWRIWIVIGLVFGFAALVTSTCAPPRAEASRLPLERTHITRSHGLAI